MAVDRAVDEVAGAAGGGFAAVVFALVGAEVERFFEFGAAVERLAFLHLAGAIATGIEGEVGFDVAGGVDLAAIEVLQGRGGRVIERGELAEGGK